MLTTTIALTALAFAAPHPPGDGHHELITAVATTAITTPVTLGPHVYAVVPDWCALPDEQPLGNTHGGIVVDPDGLIYYNTDTARAIMVHRPDGTFVRTFAPDYPGIHGMVLRVEDDTPYIYAAHLHGKQVLKLTLQGDVVWKLGVPTASGKYDDDPNSYNPTAVAVGPDGDIYVADGYGRQWIHQFDKDRNYIRSFGGRGTRPGQFSTCHGMLLDERGDTPVLLVCDRENRRLQRFTLEGKPIDVPTTGLRRPCALSTWGEYTAVAELEGRVTILDGDFNVIGHLGDNPDRSHWANNGVPPTAWTPGIFTAPHSCCYDKHGNLYVMDWNATGRMTKLQLVGESGWTWK